MKLSGFALVFALAVGCGDNVPPAVSACGADAAIPVDADAGATDAGADALVSAGPCYADPRTALRFADEAPITQDDGVDCYAVYAVFTDHAEAFCPCPDPKACGPALAQLSNEANECPALPK